MKVLDIPSSGSVNWRTASRNRNGQYIRNRSIPVQPRSTAQLAVRGYLIDAAQAWRMLSSDDRLAWKTFGSLHPKTDALGQSNAPTGEQAYVGVNAVRLLLGQTFLSTPPAEPDFSAFAEGTLSSVDGTVLVTGFACPVGGQVMVYASKPASPGRAFFGPALFLQASTVDQITPMDITAQLTARWGTPPDGSIVQIIQVPVVNGIKGAPEASQIQINAGLQAPAPIVTTNFTVTGGSAVINYTIVKATLLEGVTHWQFQYKKTGESNWVTTLPMIGTDDDGTYSGTLADSLKSGSYDVQIRWYSGTIYGLPGVWSATATATVS